MRDGIVITVLVITLAHMLWLCRVSCQRRLAEARLEISKAALELDKLMLKMEMAGEPIPNDHTLPLPQRAD